MSKVSHESSVPKMNPAKRLRDLLAARKMLADLEAFLVDREIANVGVSAPLSRAGSSLMEDCEGIVIGHTRASLAELLDAKAA